MIALVSRYGSIAISGIIGIITASAVSAQIIPDGALPTIVSSPDNLNFTIDNGSRNGPNLFHRFSQFSIPTGGSAIFRNAADIQNIFSQVTGGNVSNIDGLIQTPGTANLFLLNPSGIVFGPNAQLNIGGSFLGTTASSVKFADGVEFSATNPAPLLSLSVPIGLQMGQNPGAIVNAATYRPGPTPGGLAIGPSQTLGLLGGAVNFDRGILFSFGGNLTVGAVGANSLVGLVKTASGFELNYDQVPTFNDVQFDRESLLLAVGDAQIQVQGRQIRLFDSAIASEVVNEQSARGIQLKATELIQMVSQQPLGSGVFTQVARRGSGNGGNISLKARSIVLDQGAAVFTGAFSPTFNNQGSLGGDITIVANELRLMNGGEIGAQTNDTRNSGNVNIQANDIHITGTYPGNSTIPSVIFTTVNPGGSGNAGNVTIDTDRLRIIDGGLLAANTFDRGNAGDLTVKAKERIEIIGGSQNNFYGTGIIADATKVSAVNATAIKGDAGNIRLTTRDLVVQQGGLISVGNLGSGNAGDLTIDAKSIQLNNGLINAEVSLGAKGNITINSDLLLLRDRSQIFASAGNASDSGNITLNTPILLGLGNSDIVANALQGQGGKIAIQTQGLFGLKYRDRLTPENDITASSEFGVTGTVEVNTIGVDPNSGLVALPVDIVDPSQQIAAGCNPNQGSRFAITGRGGTPDNPTERLITDRPWADVRSMKSIAPARSPQVAAIGAPSLTEATTWQLNPQGQPELIAQGWPSNRPDALAHCAKSSDISQNHREY
jgi:filamentous hemagglutinin family protein